jgi:hypothetical protein
MPKSKQGGTKKVIKPNEMQPEVTLTEGNDCECRLIFDRRQYDNTVERGYNHLGLRYTLATALYILWYQIIPHTACVFLPCLARHI